MRPGYLHGFGVFGGKYFEVLHERSAAPIYVIKDRLQTNTAEEFGSKHDPNIRVTINPRGPKNYDFLLFRAGAPRYR
jgi:hypothetical protein